MMLKPVRIRDQIAKLHVYQSWLSGVASQLHLTFVRVSPSNTRRFWNASTCGLEIMRPWDCWCLGGTRNREPHLVQVSIVHCISVAARFLSVLSILWGIPMVWFEPNHLNHWICLVLLDNTMKSFQTRPKTGFSKLKPLQVLSCAERANKDNETSWQTCSQCHTLTVAPQYKSFRILWPREEESASLERCWTSAIHPFYTAQVLRWVTSAFRNLLFLSSGTEDPLSLWITETKTS